MRLLGGLRACGVASPPLQATFVARYFSEVSITSLLELQSGQVDDDLEIDPNPLLDAIEMDKVWRPSVRAKCFDRAGGVVVLT